MEETNQEIAIRKRAELRVALINGEIADPFTATVLGSVLLAQVLGAVGVAVVSAAATYAVGRLTQPQSQMQQVGLMKGSVQIQNSAQGLMIPEIYGGAPVVTLEPGSGAGWTGNVNVSTGANGAIHKNAGTNFIFDAAAIHSVAVADSDDAFIQGVPDMGNQTGVAFGFTTDTTPASGHSGVFLEFGVLLLNVQSGVDDLDNPVYSRTYRGVMQTIGTPDLGTWQAGDTFRVEKRGGSYHLYHDLGEVSSFTPPVPSATVYLAALIWSTGSGFSTTYVKVGGDIGLRPSAGSGGCKVPAIITWAKRPEKHSQIVNTPGGGGGKGHGGGGGQVEQIYYTIDLGAKFCRGPVDLIRLYANTDVLLNFDPQLIGPTGVFDPDAGATIVYDPNFPPDPNVNDTASHLRFGSDLIEDPGDPGTGGGTGTFQGGGAGIAVYPGNQTQLTDPTEEADIDSIHGPNSTTAGRGHSRIVTNDLNLTRWSGLPPNLTGVWQHQTLKTLGPIFVSLCSRIIDENGVSLLTAGDYDWSSLDAVLVRGLLIDGRRFGPAEIIDNTEVQDVYNYFTTEGDGKMLAYVNGTEPSITIPWEEFGWLDGAAEVPEIFEPLIVTKADETKLPTQIDLKYINPGDDWDPDTESSMRRVTLGNTMELLQVSLTLNPDEARTMTDRRLLRAYIEGDSIKFTLSWTYLYIYPGYKIITTSPAGITYTMRLTSANGGVGVRDCEAIALEISAFDPSDVGTIKPVYNPSQPVPSVTILAALDIPNWRDSEDVSFGLWVAGAPRDTSIQSWSGFVPFIKRGSQWDPAEAFTAAATMGRVVSATGLVTDPLVTDNVGVIVVDLYGTKATLSSISEADMIAGARWAAVGDMIIGFATAVRVEGFLNRWTLTVLRNGQFNTHAHISDDQTNRNFVVLDAAVKFVHLDRLTDFNTPIKVKAVSLGASLADTAEVSVICTGQNGRARPVLNHKETKDASNDWLFQFDGDPRPNEEPADYAIEIWDRFDFTNPANRKRTLPLTDGTSHAVLLKTMGDVQPD